MKIKSLVLLKKVIGFTLLTLLLLPICTMGIIADGENIMSENYALGNKAVVNNEYRAQPASYAVDGDQNSFWRTLSSCKDNFASFIVPLGGNNDINLIYLKPYGYELMTSIKLQYTKASSPSASSSWIELKTFDKSEIAEIMVVDFDQVGATGIRFYADVTGHSVGLYEIEAYFADDTEKAIDQLKNPPPPSPYEFSQGKYIDAEIVSVDENGMLIYKSYDQNGATLMDYSYVGYKRGEQPIPDVEVVKTLEVGTLTDHTALIQNAIDEIAALPLEERGAILLKAGKYKISAKLTIDASGIVLRGEGQGENGTVIYDARKKQDTSLSIQGSGAYTVIPGSKVTLTDDLVTMGNTTLTLSSVDVYRAGDTVRVVCTPNDLWVQTLGMDKLPGTSVQWTPEDYVITYERVVMAIDITKNTVTLDTSIPLTLDSRYYSVTVEKIRDSASRVTDSGVENLRFESYFNPSLKDANGNYNDENHGWNAIRIGNARDCFVRDVSAKYYGLSAVTVASGAINVTVEGCSYLSPVSNIEGSRRYSFNLNGGQYTLFKNCYSYDSRHDYVLGSSKNPGPNVFLTSVAEDSNSVSEPHNRWSTGVLYDNIYQIGSLRLGNIQAINRGSSGTGHGWSGANVVIWNSLSPATVVGKPQTEQNFAVGAYGIYDVDKTSYIHVYKNYFVQPSIVTPNYPSAKSYSDSPMHGNGYIEAPYNPVNPSSLYKAQLSMRLYGDATKNVIPGAPILNAPAADSTHAAHTVTVNGIADVLSEKVFVYVNGEKHQAEIIDNAYSLDLNLENGYYDIYVTQVIDGIESEKNATRTILVDSSEPYVPDTDIKEPQEPADPTETLTPSESNEPIENDDPNANGSQEKKTNAVLPIMIGIGAAIVVGVLCVLAVKKSKKTK